MKRAEIIRRLRRGSLSCAALSGRSVSGGLLASLDDDSLVAIAEWLGIEVEPDDEPLPDTMWFHGGCIGGGVAGAPYLRTFYDYALDRRVAQALVDAYNNRPRWRPAEERPPGVGTHVASTVSSYYTVCYWDGVRWSYRNGDTAIVIGWILTEPHR